MHSDNFSIVGLSPSIQGTPCAEHKGHALSGLPLYKQGTVAQMERDHSTP
ncbi:hypothetical protein ACJJI4_16515 [Microbulbifer sp. TRSA002]